MADPTVTIVETITTLEINESNSTTTVEIQSDSVEVIEVGIAGPAGSSGSGSVSGTGLITQTAEGPTVQTVRTITGTSNRISVTDGDGVSGNPTLTIADNADLPGTAGMLLPAGTTAQRVDTARRLRYNTQTNIIEWYNGTDWIQPGTAGGEANQNAFAIVTGDSGSANADATQDTIAFTGGDGVVTSVAETPDGLVIDLDVTGLTNLGGAPATGDSIIVYDVSASALREATVGNVFTSPALTGTPTAPTAAPGTDSTQLATTAFVEAAVTAGGGGDANQNAFSIVTGDTGTATSDIPEDTLVVAGGSGITTVATDGPETVTISFDISGLTDLGAAPATADSLALLDASVPGLREMTIGNLFTGPAFTGVPTAPTAVVNTNTTQLATTAFVVAEIADAGGGGGEANQNAFSIVTGDTGTATSDVAEDTLVVAGGSGITTVATDGPETVTISFDIPGLTDLGAAPATADTLAIFDASATALREMTIGNLFTAPTFTGIPAAPTASVNTNTTQLATTAFVVAEIADFGAEANQNSFSIVTGDTGTATSDIAEDTLVVAGGSGITTVATDGPETVTISFDIPGLTDLGAAPATADTLAIFDASATALREMTIGNLFTAPTFTGVPAAPTAAVNTNTTQLATTAFVVAEIADTGAEANQNSFSIVTGDTGTATSDIAEDTLVVAGGSGITTVASDGPETITISLDIPGLTDLGAAPATADSLAIFDASGTALREMTIGNLFTGPTFTGVPAAPTAAPGTDSTQIATTAFVEAAVTAGGGGGGATVTASSTEPVSPSAGDLWYQTDDGVMYIRFDDGDTTQWVPVDSQATVGSGVVVQEIEAEPDATFRSTTATFPFDDTIPQSTEGTALPNEVTITPTSAANRLVIEVEAPMSISASAHMILALFKDSDTGALATIAHDGVGVSAVSSLIMKHTMVAGTTSPITFKLRYGGTSGTTYLNGNNSARRFGGTMNTRLRVRELRV